MQLQSALRHGSARLPGSKGETPGKQLRFPLLLCECQPKCSLLSGEAADGGDPAAEPLTPAERAALSRHKYLEQRRELQMDAVVHVHNAHRVET